MNNMNNPEQLSLYFAAKQHQQALAKILNYFLKDYWQCSQKEELGSQVQCQPQQLVPRMAIRTSMGSFNQKKRFLFCDQEFNVDKKIHPEGRVIYKTFSTIKMQS